MSIFDFFHAKKQKMPQGHAQASVPNDRTVSNDLNEQFSKQTKNINTQFDELFARLDDGFTDIKDTMDTLHAQSANDEQQKKLIEALMGLYDLLESFYAYAAQTSDTALCEQAIKMCQSAQKRLEIAGVVRIGNVGQGYNPACESAVGTVWDEASPSDTVMRVLSSGYIYNGRMMRRAQVVVNKEKEL